MALLACINNAIELDIYPDVENKSTGQIYVDDGETFKFKLDSQSSSLVQFDFADNKLALALLKGEEYLFPESQRIHTVSLHGAERKPTAVYANGKEVEFTFEEHTVVVKNLNVEMVSGQVLEFAYADEHLQ